jgi:uncharacterized protein (DUF1330 family)
MTNMPAFNIVRFRVKAGQAESFIDAHRKLKQPSFKGFGGGWLVRTGDNTFCLVGQWRTFQSIVNARPEMIKMLDETRAMLEDLGGGLGVTDPVSGSAVLKLGATKAAQKRGAATRKAKPARKRSATSRKAKPAKKRAAAARKRA